MIKNYLMCLMLLFGVSNTMLAQQVKGMVVDQSAVPIPGVSVVVKGTTTGTATDFDGNYTIAASIGDVLMFSYVGYETQEVTVNANIVNVTMKESLTALEEVVITGLATTTKRSNLANTVATISASELTGVTVQSGLDGALAGKFNGAEIKSNSGAPGGGISMKLRGVTSIFGDQQPLFIVDGVYVDNSSISLGNNIVSEAAGGGNPSNTQDDASNRIADIDPEDVESVDILKGASAAAIYGSRAAGGVVIIKTKRGKQGIPRVSFSQTISFISPTNLLGLRDWDQDEITALGGPINPVMRNYEDELFDHVRVSTTSRFSTSGGTDKTDYFFGATYKDQPGLLENTGYDKASIRLNIGQRFTDWLDLYVTTNYINSTSDRGYFNNSNNNSTIGYALAFTYPWENLSPVDGVYPAGGAGSNVLETAAITVNREEVNRFIGSATSNIKLFTKDMHQLKMVLQAGFDQYTLRTTSIFPRELTYYRSPESLRGVSISGTTVNTNYNLSASLVHNLFFDNGLEFTTQVGSFIADFDRNTVITIATGLNGSQTNLGQSTNVSTEQTIRPQKDTGFFVQEEINYDDKIIATFGVTGDKSTNNGDVNKMYYYPKANLAVNIHEFDFWNVKAISSLKPRVAYGEAGRFANFNDRFSLMDPQLIGGVSGLSPDNLRGNPDVGPERQKELEYGVDFGLLDNRFNFEVTLYNKKIDDVLLQLDVPTSSGFTAKVDNAAELENRGIELGLNADVITNEDFTWNTNLKWWKNKSEVTRLDVPSFTEGGFAASLGTFLIQEGESATQIVGSFDSEGLSPEELAALDPDGDGFAVYGNAEADFQMSWQNNFRYKNFDLSFLWHWKQGGDNINLSTFLYDLAGTTWDYDDTDLDPSGQLSNGVYRATSTNPDPFVEDAGFLKLREIGLFYTLPKDLVKGLEQIRVGFSGRNLINIFDYNSYDPEVSNFGNNVLANNVEVGPYPASKFVNFHLNVNF